jgi:streptogramin lyase
VPGYVRIFALVLAGSLAACGGGAGTSSSAIPLPKQGASPSNTATPASTSTPAPTSSPSGDAHFTIGGQYVSPATSAIQITANGATVKLSFSPSSSAVDVPVDDGPLTYAVKTLGYDGAVLAQASGTATIEGTTTIPLTLQSVWKTATVLFANEHPLMGTPSTIAITVSAYDADNDLIGGTNPYATPIELQNSDTSGATTLSKTSLSYPCQCASLTYDGKSYVNTTVTPVNPATGIPGLGDILVPALHVTEYPVPSGSVAATVPGHGRMIVNADSTITFLEQNMRLGHVNMNGAVTETPTAHSYSDIVKAADGTLWGVSNDTVYQIEAGGSDAQIAQLPAWPDSNVANVLTVGSDGNVWATIGTTLGPAATRITPTGAMTSFVSVGPQSLGDSVLGSDGNIWYAASKNGAGEFERLTPSGTFTEFPVPAARGPLGDVALGPDGQIYSLIVLQGVERVSPAGAVSSLPDFNIEAMAFYGQSVPNAVVFGPDGALWISGAVDSNAYCDPVVERITTSGAEAMLELPLPCDDFNGPLEPITAFAAGPDGNLWYTRDKDVGKILLP